MPDDHYHEGRPVIRDGREHIIALCPFGHLLHTMPKREWAGSWLEGVASDPNWRMKCYGAMPTSSKRSISG